MNEEDWLGFSNQIDMKEFERQLIDRALQEPIIYNALVESLQETVALVQSHNSAFIPGVEGFELKPPEEVVKLLTSLAESLTEGEIARRRSAQTEFFKDTRLENYKTLVDRTTVLGTKFSEIVADCVLEYSTSDCYSSPEFSDPECQATLFNEIIDRESEHINAYIYALPPKLGVKGMELEAQEFLIKRHVEIIRLVERGLSFHKKYLETKGVGITTTGAEIFINAFNKRRKILFKDYLTLINKDCDEISLITDTYLPTGWSINKIFQKIGYRIRWDWQKIQDSKFQEIESLKIKIDKMYLVLEELVAMTKDTGMKKSLRLVIENAEEQLNEIRNRINMVYSTYLQRRNSLKRFKVRNIGVS